MRKPGVFLAYEPRTIGLRCALACLGSQRDVYGWFTGPCSDGSIASCYFVLEDFYHNAPTRYAVVNQADLHSHWALDEARRHQLARMQKVFAREWLLEREDPGAAKELQAYAEAGLAAGEVNVRFGRLAQFSTAQPDWIYCSPRFERSVLRQLDKRWPLEYRVDIEPMAVR
jgi:hypothetical protein